MSIYISDGTGSGQIRTIVDYVGSTKVATVAAWTTNPAGDSVYEVMPTVTVTSTDGSNATARVSSVDGGVIKKVSMNVVGTGYRAASASVTGGAGSGCTLEPRIGPKSGHGKNAKTELGGAYVMMNVRLTGTEGGDFTVGDDFRKVILIANPNAGGAAATASTYSGAEMDDDSGDPN